jgi:hypothetical protein
MYLKKSNLAANVHLFRVIEMEPCSQTQRIQSNSKLQEVNQSWTLLQS